MSKPHGVKDFLKNTTPHKDILYLCDPRKNKECRKTACYHNPRSEYGLCQWTTDRRYSKDGKEYVYNEETGDVERKK